jgi:hypothetical protein
MDRQVTRDLNSFIRKIAGLGMSTYYSRYRMVVWTLNSTGQPSERPQNLFFFFFSEIQSTILRIVGEAKVAHEQ